MLMNVSMNLTTVTRTQSVRILSVVSGVSVTKVTTLKMMVATNVSTTTNVLTEFTTTKLIT